MQSNARGRFPSLIKAAEGCLFKHQKYLCLNKHPSAYLLVIL